MSLLSLGKKTRKRPAQASLVLSAKKRNKAALAVLKDDEDD